KFHVAAFLKPADGILRAGKPWFRFAQVADQIAVEIPPKPLRGMTTVVPDSGKASPVLLIFFDHGATALCGFGFGQVPAVGIKQRPILRRDRQLQQPLYAQRAKYLAGPGTVADGFVVTNRRVVLESCLIEKR